jgi:ADP-ribose pyrophosphatase YjhB (NUDIX family)
LPTNFEKSGKMESTQYRKNSHCSYCGHPFAADQPWPRTCGHCQNLSFINPLPVTVLVIPVAGGVLAVRRGIPPRQGALALPGGYMDVGETWQQAGAREADEEAGVVVDPATVQVLRVFSASDNSLIVVGLAAPLLLADLPPFAPTAEATERVILTAPTELAFPLHTEVLRDYFQTRAP